MSTLMAVFANAGVDYTERENIPSSLRIYCQNKLTLDIVLEVRRAAKWLRFTPGYTSSGYAKLPATFFFLVGTKRQSGKCDCSLVFSWCCGECPLTSDDLA